MVVATNQSVRKLSFTESELWFIKVKQKPEVEETEKRKTRVSL